jgi:WD40 repeat protein
MPIGLVFLVAAAVFIRPANADDGTEAGATETPISFYHDVRPIFQAHCFGCHQPARRRGELDMTSRDALLKGGESEDPAVVPGKPDAGTLLAMITPASDRPPEMPKGRPALSADAVALIRGWIEQGAEDDTPKSAGPRFTDEHPPTYRLAPVVTAIDFSPDGSLLAVSGYHEVVLHSVDVSGADGSEIVARLIGMSERIESVKFSPNGKWLAATGGAPGRFGEVQIWDVARRRLERSVVVTFDTVYGASWSHDERLVAFGCGDSTLRAIEVESGNEVFYQSAHDDWVLDSVFSVDASHLVSVSRDRSMKLYDVATQRFMDDITSITPGALKGGLHAVDRHPTLDQLLVGGADGVPKIYRMHREKERQIGDDFNLIRKFPEMPGCVYDVRYSRDGNTVLAASSTGAAGHVWVFQESDGKLIAKMQDIEGGIYRAVFSPDGKTVASGGFDGLVFLNEAASGKLIKKFAPVPLSAADRQGE